MAVRPRSDRTRWRPGRLCSGSTKARLLRRWSGARRCNTAGSSCGILDSGFGEASRSNQAAVTMAARLPVWTGIVATMRQAEVHAEFGPETDDAALGQMLQRREEPQRTALDAGL